jgi:hypothetical protein
MGCRFQNEGGQVSTPPEAGEQVSSAGPASFPCIRCSRRCRARSGCERAPGNLLGNGASRAISAPVSSPTARYGRRCHRDAAVAGGRSRCQSANGGPTCRSVPPLAVAGRCTARSRGCMALVAGGDVVERRVEQLVSQKVRVSARQQQLPSVLADVGAQQGAASGDINLGDSRMGRRHVSPVDLTRTYGRVGWSA